MNHVSLPYTHVHLKKLHTSFTLPYAIHPCGHSINHIHNINSHIYRYICVNLHTMLVATCGFYTQCSAYTLHCTVTTSANCRHTFVCHTTESCESSESHMYQGRRTTKEVARTMCARVWGRSWRCEGLATHVCDSDPLQGNPMLRRLLPPMWRIVLITVLYV